MLGFQLITQLNTLIKTSRIHGRARTRLSTNPSETMLTLIETLAHDQPVTLWVQDDFLFLGNNHLEVTAQQMLVVSSILDNLKKVEDRRFDVCLIRVLQGDSRIRPPLRQS